MDQKETSMAHINHVGGGDASNQLNPPPHGDTWHSTAGLFLIHCSEWIDL